jgi:uncharacterized glyoxalase superfamily protein PhnB
MNPADDDGDLDLDPVRRLRPDGVLPADVPDVDALASGRRRLLEDITGDGDGDGVPDPSPLATPSIYPRLAYRDEVAALDFLVRAFGLVERREARMEHPDGMLAWLELGNGLVMIGRSGADRHGLASPADTGMTTAMVNAYVPDVDAHHRQAAAAGARIVAEPEDMLWGDRRYEALDLEGHRWHFAQRRAPVSPRQR